MTATRISVQDLRERIGDKAKADPRHRFWGMYVHLCRVDVLREAYRLAKKNDGAPGIDGMTFADIEVQGVENFIEALSQDLRAGKYRPMPCRKVGIPKEGGKKERGLKIPTIRDRVVQGALRLILEPIFESDFQPGSFGYRPGRTAHQALGRVYEGLNRRLYRVINLDLQGYFDSVRHDLLLSKLAQRIRDKDVLALCKRILKASGKRGLPQGSVIGPLWANVYLNDVDRMLERAQEATRQGRYEVVSYTRFADDLAVLVSTHPNAAHWGAKVERRLREELGKLDLQVNDEKSRIIDFGRRDSFDFLGFTFRLVDDWVKPGRTRVLRRPRKDRRTRFLRDLTATLRRCRHIAVEDVVREVVNPRVRGWVNYFRWGNSGRDLAFVRWQVSRKVRRFASRQRPKRKGGCRWTKWGGDTVYGEWGLFHDYRVAHSFPSG